MLADLAPENYNELDMSNNSVMSQERQEKDDLKNAWKKCQETGELTPLLKQELRFSIKCRRSMEGKEEIRIEPPIEKKMELTAHEIEKKRKRREQNRLAALRFRQKNKNKGSTLEQEIGKLQKEHEALKKVYQDLVNERDTLVQRLKEHFQYCALRPASSELQVLFSRHGICSC